jgi:hypothetical protein
VRLHRRDDRDGPAHRHHHRRRRRRPAEPDRAANPIVPPNPVCPQLGSFAIRYGLAFAADNTITAATAQTDPVT